MQLFYKFCYKIGILFCVLCKKAVLRFYKPEEKIAGSAPLFLITSTINFTNSPLGVNQDLPRSCLSPSLRFDQTLESIKSIRLHVPNAVVVLLENSSLSIDQKNILEPLVEHLILISERNFIKNFWNKGLPEIYLLLSFFKKRSLKQYSGVFKLSGRYSLSSDFKFEFFKTSKFIFTQRDGVYSTRLYYVPICQFGFYKTALCFALFPSLMGVPIEVAFAHLIDKSQIKFLSPIGVKGQIAVQEGEWINE